MELIITIGGMVLSALSISAAVGLRSAARKAQVDKALRPKIKYYEFLYDPYHLRAPKRGIRQRLRIK